MVFVQDFVYEVGLKNKTLFNHQMAAEYLENIRQVLVKVHLFFK